MKKFVLIPLTVLTVVSIAGIAVADDPDGHVQNAKNLLNQAQAELDAAIAVPQPIVTETVTQTATQTITVTVAPTTTAAPPTTTSPPTTTTPAPTTTAPPPAGTVVLSGTRNTQYKPAPATDTIYDFRDLTSIAYPFGSSFPLVIDGTRNVVLGGTVIGQQDRNATWATVHDVYGGKALSMHITESGASYGLRADNVNDGYGPLPSVGLTGQFLLEGAYMTWIRDDAIEDDTEMSGTIRDILVDGVNDAISIGQSTKNSNAVVNVVDAIFIHAPMRNDRAADGIGHQTLFKQAPGGRVNLTNVTDCMYENPISPGRIGIRPPGIWTNVVFVLGPGWMGPDPVVPAGATVSHDWQGLCVDAASAWRVAHGYGN